MYSLAWFDSFARTLPVAATAADVAAIRRLAPPDAFPDVLDLGCGTGRTAAPLAAHGYNVTGVDSSPVLLQEARRTAPALRLVALDHRHTARLRWRFDLVLSLWHSLGFGRRADDLMLLRAVRTVLRAGGRFLLDVYHPDWLARRPQESTSRDGRTHVRRWIENGRCHHIIRYPDGMTERISFNVYAPPELRRLASAAGFRVARQLVHWESTEAPGPDHARYQLVLHQAR